MADGFKIFAVDEFYAGARLEVPRRFGKHLLVVSIPENEPVIIVQQGNALRQAIYHLAELGAIGHGMLPRNLDRSDSFTELKLRLAQLHAVKRNARQPFKRILLLPGDSTGHGVGDGQRSQGKAFGIAERDAGVEPDMIRSRHHGAGREPLVAGCVRHDHDAIVLHGVIAKTDGPGNFFQINSNAGLEPVALRLSRAKEGYRRVEQVRQQSGDVVKCRFRRRPRYPVSLQTPEPFLFGRIAVHRFSPSPATRPPPASSLGSDSGAENFITC